MILKSCLGIVLNHLVFFRRFMLPKNPAKTPDTIQPQLLICRLSWGKCPPRNQWIFENSMDSMFFLHQISKCGCNNIWTFAACTYPEIHMQSKRSKKNNQSIQLTNPSSNFHWTNDRNAGRKFMIQVPQKVAVCVQTYCSEPSRFPGKAKVEKRGFYK